jgi:hypothetical protein
MYYDLADSALIYCYHCGHPLSPYEEIFPPPSPEGVDRLRMRQSKDEGHEAAC